MKILPELLLDSTGLVHFVSKKVVFANASYYVWTEYKLPTC